jgi:2-oxoglutarate/2-oxoacid ferredoxin oxidoreductase subunit alpha
MTQRAPLHRYTLKAAGESGQGVNSVGEILAKSLKESGLYTFGYREYPSLIKGGYSCHQIDISDQPLLSPSAQTDLLVCLSRVSVHKYLPTVRPGAIVLHSLPQMEFSSEEQAWIDANQVHIAYVNATQIALETSGNALMANTVMIGLIWKLVGLKLAPVEEVVKHEFAKKPEVIEGNLKCLQAGFVAEVEGLSPVELDFKLAPELEANALLSGNHILSLGAVAAGVRAYYAYPMTPSSSILSYLSSIYHETGMLVKQIEDEISVAQMAIGSMFMGTRALVGTSGGGFDLMTESLSLSGMTETPFVCILGQRPGPATGLPTWTAAGDLNLAVYAGHGEYTRCVVAVSDPESCYTLIQHAFNLAEEFQIPVIVLTEKQIAESLFQMSELPADLPIERYLVPDEKLGSLQASDRYQITETGVSARWLPGQSDAVFDANSDEHLEDGTLTEEAVPTQAMYEKRLRKLEYLEKKLPEPRLIGPATAALSFVGWGSVKNTMVDVIQIWNEAHAELSINYLHYDYIFPLKTDSFSALADQAKKVVLIENNALGQLGALITQTTGYQFEHRLLKYDGRGFFVEDVMQFLEKELSI